jgi:hypothetical protein
MIQPKIIIRQEKKKMRKITAILLIMAMVLAFTACGGGDEPSSGTTPRPVADANLPGDVNIQDAHDLLDSFMQSIDDDDNGDDVGDGNTSYASAKAGDVIEFSGANWLVLEVKDGKALLLKERLAGSVKFRITRLDDSPRTWEYSDLREYLNDEFYNERFTPAERERIVETTVVTEGNPENDRDGGNDTQDKIFVLSLEDVNTYFPKEDDETRVAYHLSPDGSEDDHGAAGGWWLRTPGVVSSFVSLVNRKGSVSLDGIGGINESGVRPAMWIELQ